MEISKNNYPNSTLDEQQSNNIGCLNIIIFFAIFLWIIFVSLTRHISIFFLTINPTPSIRTPNFISTLIQIFLIGIPLIPLSIFWSDKLFRKIYRSWLLAWAVIILFLPITFIDPSAAQSYTVTHIILLLLYILAIHIFLKKLLFAQESSQHIFEYSKSENSETAWLCAISIGITIGIPWLYFGAFGSISDTFLQLTFSILFGIASSLIITILFKNLNSPILDNPIQKFFIGGLNSGMILFLLSSSIAYGFNGIQLFLMALLPSLGWVIIALNLLGVVSFSNKRNDKSTWGISNQTIPIGILIGLVAAAPLSLLDPDELVLVLNSTPGEILSTAFQALLFSILIQFGICIFLILIFVFRRQKYSSSPELEKPQKKGLVFLVISVLLSICIGGFIYFAKGQPGFYGEHIFIVLRKQADISSIPKSNNYQDQRQQVFNTLVYNAKSSQEDIISNLDRFNIPYTQYYLVNAIEVPNNPIIRIWMALHPEVDRILPSPHLRPLPKDLPVEEGSYESISESNWNLSMIDADRVWSEFGVTGEGIIVGQSDSGVQADHPELANSYRGKIGGNDFNWYDPWNHTSSPVDLGGHGTHTLGTIVGENVGVAPGANWYACVNLARNLANPALYLDCMQFMFAPFPLDGDPFTQGDPSKGAHIINNSWGCPEIEGCDPFVFQPAVSALRYAGVFVVASAGNDGPKCETLNYPLPIYEDVFSVGAIDRSGNLANFSSIGPVNSDGSNRIKPDIVAPGVSIISSTPGNTYASYSGTSMAGPHVAGVVALIWSANPSLIGNIDLTEEIIIKSAKPYKGTLPNCPGVNKIPSNAFGFGIINAYDAVKAAIEYNP